MSLVLLNQLETEIKKIPATIGVMGGLSYTARNIQDYREDVLEIINKHKAEYRQKDRYCDCCGVPLTEENNKCGFCICDKCNKELEEWHKKKYGGSPDER